jgi:hypothetical protein
MITEVTLYLVKPGEQMNSFHAVGRFVIRDIAFSGQLYGPQRCLDIEVESLPPSQVCKMPVGSEERPVAFTWLQLTAEIWTWNAPRHRIGQIHIDQKGMLPIGPSRSERSRWLWELRPEDVELVELNRSNQANAQLIFQLEITGIAKVVDAVTGQFLCDVVPVRANNAQLKMELSHWERLIQYMDYKVPSTQAALAGLSSVQHPSWNDAATRLEPARSHLRAGEDYDALRKCLSTLESLVSPPYAANPWKERLKALPEQKATGLAELFSGMATFCNKVGHHRSRDERNAAGDLPQMPLDHWEAELAVGAAQFVTAYALRLRAAGLLAEAPPASEEKEEGTPNV